MSHSGIASEGQLAFRRRLYNWNTKGWVKYSIGMSEIRKVSFVHRYGQGYLWIEHRKGRLPYWEGFIIERDDFDRLKQVLSGVLVLVGKIESKD